MNVADEALQILKENIEILCWLRLEKEELLTPFDDEWWNRPILGDNEWRVQPFPLLPAPKKTKDQFTQDYAIEWAEWRKTVRQTYSFLFLWIDEGMWVRDSSDRVGKCWNCDYFPEFDIWQIQVMYGSTIVTYTTPIGLEEVANGPEHYKY